MTAYLVGSDEVENAFPQGTSGLGNGAVDSYLQCFTSSTVHQ